MMEIRLEVGQVVRATAAEGPGLRFALWLQGCPLRCPGCCNPEFLVAGRGEWRPLRSLVDELDAALAEGIEGITLLGGEPLAQAAGAAAFAREARMRGLSVMLFTGYTLEEARELGDEARSLLALCDVVVDGPYLREQPETRRRWIGSRNQRVHFLTDRYRPDDPCWTEANTLEIRVRGGEIIINGFPSRRALDLWRPTTRRPA